MEGLPHELNALCRQIFLECDQFESYQRLRSFCRGHDALYFINFKLEKASSCESLFELNLPIFLENKHQKYGWIFPIFVKALATACPEGDDRRNSLDDLYAKIIALQEQYQSCKPSSYSLDENRLFECILQIDFEEQDEKVTNALKQLPNKTAAFLIHGEEKFGQETLVTRFSRLEKFQNVRQIKIKMAEMYNISDLWNAVARNFINYHIKFSQDQVIDLVIECVTTQDLIFIFTEDNRTRRGFISKVIEQFWQPIVESINLSNNHYLVMFLVDNKGKDYKYGIPLALDVEQSEYPKMPLYLPPTTRFLRNDISQWLRMAVATGVVRKGLSVEKLLQESKDGVPELVYQKICDHCGSSWEGILAQCLIQ